MDAQDLNDYQLIKIVSNDVIGEVKILKSSGRFYLAKKLDNVQIGVLRDKAHVIDHLNRNTVVFQRCYGRFIINNESHLLFDYYDYTLNDLFRSNCTNRMFLAEESLLKLIKVSMDGLSSLFSETCFYHPFVDMRTINISAEGEIKISNPLLFNEFIGLRRLGHSDYKEKFYSTIDKVGIIALEQTALNTIVDADGNVELDRLETAFKVVRQKYSIILLNILRMFGYNLVTERDDKFLNLVGIDSSLVTSDNEKQLQTDNINLSSMSKRRMKIFDKEDDQREAYSRVSNFSKKVKFMQQAQELYQIPQQIENPKATSIISNDRNANYLNSYEHGNHDSYIETPLHNNQRLFKSSAGEYNLGSIPSNKIKSLILDSNDESMYDQAQNRNKKQEYMNKASTRDVHNQDRYANQNQAHFNNKIIDSDKNFFSMYDSKDLDKEENNMKATLKYGQGGFREPGRINHSNEDLKQSYYISKAVNQVNQPYAPSSTNYYIQQEGTSKRYKL